MARERGQREGDRPTPPHASSDRPVWVKGVAEPRQQPRAGPSGAAFALFAPPVTARALALCVPTSVADRQPCPLRPALLVASRRWASRFRRASPLCLAPRGPRTLHLKFKVPA